MLFILAGLRNPARVEKMSVEEAINFYFADICAEEIVIDLDVDDIII